MSKTALILGSSGKAGHHSAKAFQDKGWQIRLFDRHNEDMNTAAQDVDVIVNGMNPPNYHDWATIIPTITRNVIEAARINNATVFIPGNVYHFGDTEGVWSEKTPARAISRKGKIRLEMENTYRESGVQTIILRAGNFIDPYCRGCILSLIYLSHIKHGKIILPGKVDKRQAFCYLPDWAQAVVAIAERRNTLTQFEDIPFPGHTLTALELKAQLEKHTGQNLKFSPFPWWLFSLTSPFWELAREMNEMRYLWNTDHALCGKRFHTILPNFKNTDLECIFPLILKHIIEDVSVVD